MTADAFRRLALSFEGVIEAEHRNHPDFRVRGKIFATLAYPSRQFGMVKLTPEQQAELVHDAPEVFTPVPGGWGRKGCTHVRLRAATQAVLLPAIEAAWRNAIAQAAKPGKRKTVRFVSARSSR
jgi:hypothetical protein